MMLRVNKPNPPLHVGAEDPGPLDADGQQIWSPETEAAIARLHADPLYWAGIEEAIANIEAGRGFTSEELATHSRERKHRWLAERGV